MILSGTHPVPLSGELGVFSLLGFLVIYYRKIREKASSHTSQKLQLHFVRFAQISLFYMKYLNFFLPFCFFYAQS